MKCFLPVSIIWAILPEDILPIFGIIRVRQRVTKVLKIDLNFSHNLQDVLEDGTLAVNRGGKGGTLGLKCSLEEGRCKEVRGGRYGGGSNSGDGLRSR